ncbi:uncharacterized protein [Hetaerina americana]|uniref:uncharacterized protein n=1 Tax=Hetaerina americana TaxID=62018 RepID=UPI003A7F38AD
MEIVASGQKICSYLQWSKALFLLPLISLVTGAWEKYAIENNEWLHEVKYICHNAYEDLEVTPDLSIKFLNASTLEISKCRKVTLHSNLFRRSYDLHSISISQLDELSIDPALSFPVSLQSLSLSSIESLDHFPVPGPSSALLQSVKSLQLLSLENITIKAAPTTSTSSFIDLPITKVHMNGVKFIGDIPAGMLHFNTNSLAQFTSTNCQFGDMVEGSIYIHASGNVNIDNCKFKSMQQESMKVYGQSISFNNNIFKNLHCTHSIFIQGFLNVSITKNIFKSLDAPHALLLDANKNAAVYIKDNQLPCGCYASNFIPAAPRTINQSNCAVQHSITCALQQKQHCLQANGKNETIQISRSELPSCPDSETEPTSGSVGHGRVIGQNIVMVLYFSFLMIVHMI